MSTPTFLDRIDSLIEDLLNDSDLSSSSTASILMAGRESVRDGYHVAPVRRLWDANDDLLQRQYPRQPALPNTRGPD